MVRPSVPSLVLPADPTGAAGRRLRALVFALASVGLAAGAHAAGGGSLPRWWLVAGAVWATQAAVLPLTGRERRLPSLLPAMAALQAALHLAFALATREPAHGMAMAMPMPLLPRPDAMLAAHAVTALALGAWLRYGEQRFFRAAAGWARATEARVERVVATTRIALACLAGILARLDVPGIVLAAKPGVMVGRSRWCDGPRPVRGPPACAPLPGS